VRGFELGWKARPAPHVTRRQAPGTRGEVGSVAFWCSSIIATKRAAHVQEQPPLRLAHREHGACLATPLPRIPRKCADGNMAPNKAHDSDADHAQEREEFLDTLEQYHEKRG
jgi:hypothetical protein